MEIRPKSKLSVVITLSDGSAVHLEEQEGRGHSRLKVTCPNDRISYETEQGFNNADYISVS